MANFLDFLGTGDDTAVDEAQIDAAINACMGDNPCEAAWQASYAYAADQAYKLAVFQALQGIAFGVLQYASADRTADLQYDIANRQMVIAEEEYQRYKDVYVECENALAEEICAITLPDTDYDTGADRATRDVVREFSRARRNIQRTRSRYCVNDTIRAVFELEKAQALAIVQARDIAYRYAEERKEYFDTKRWERRVLIQNHGRNVMTGQSNFYTSGMSSAQVALDAKQDNLDNFLGTVSGGIGAVLNARSVVNQSDFGMRNAFNGRDFRSSVPSATGLATGNYSPGGGIY